MYVHSIFNVWTYKVVVFEPQEVQIVPLSGADIEAVKHLLDVAGEGNLFLSKVG